MRFCQRTMGLTLTVDQGANVNQVSPTAFVGLVDDWHRWLASNGVRVRGGSKDDERTAPRPAGPVTS